MDGYLVQPIKREEAIPWIKLKHYARRIPAISHSFGLFKNGVLKGICTFGLPPSHHLCIGICGPKLKDIVIELNRLCLENNLPNEASFLISNSLKLLPKPRIIISFADSGKNHIGYVYQSTNWIYVGVTDYGRKPRFDRTSFELNKHGRHDKSNTEITRRSKKHRYVYFTGSRKQKKEMLKELRYPILPYPKGETKRYDTSTEFAKQEYLF